MISKQKPKPLLVEPLEERSLLTIGWVGHAIDSISPIDSRHEQSVDFDLDGDMDIVYASGCGPGCDRILWHENLGVGGFGEPKELFTPELAIENVLVANADGDGDQDLYVAQGGIVLLLINENESFEIGATFETSADYVDDVKAADIDDDGDLDLVVAGAGYGGGWSINWYENLDGQGDFGDGKHITSSNNSSLYSSLLSLHISDMDNDQDLDVVVVTTEIAVGGGGRYHAFWLGNSGSGKFTSAHTVFATSIPPALANPPVLAVARISADGPADVFSHSSDLTGSSLTRYQLRPDGSYSSSTILQLDELFAFSAFSPDLIPQDELGSAALVSGDIDGDGDTDALIGGQTVYLLENDGGQLNPKVIMEAPISIQVLGIEDWDGDGDGDLLMEQYVELGWIKNLGHESGFQIQPPLAPHPASKMRAVVAEDVDGDSDLDVLFAAVDGVGWYENDGREGLFAPLRMLSELDFSTASALQFIDVDGDSDSELTGVFHDWSDEVKETRVFDLDNGRFVQFAQFSEPLRCCGESYLQDIDADGDRDFLRGDGKVFENLNGHGPFVESTEESGINMIRDRIKDFGDLDGDGDPDAIAERSDRKLVWYENNAGMFQADAGLGISRSLGVDFFPWVGAADFDGDGDLDVFGASGAEPLAVWYENTDGRGSFSEEISIPFANSFADLDGDSDLDALRPSFWAENLDGGKTFGEPTAFFQRFSQSISSTGPLAGDFDGDGDEDVLSFSTGIFSQSANSLAWYENRLAGDTDDNGRVDFDDFLDLSAKFGKQVDAVWADGDFDGNGNVDFADFLVLSENFGSTRP